jgi:SAM-dependent methyltransferase
MHLSSLRNMEWFRDQFLLDKSAQAIKIFDLGSTEMGACYRPLFDNPNWNYIGFDLQPGPNVTCVVKDPYRWHEIGSDTADVLISGQVLEHVEFFWMTILEVARVLKPGGVACLIAPSSGPEHRFPVDCWRFYPDGMSALARFGALDVLHVKTDWTESGDPGSDLWHDTMIVLKKSKKSVKTRILNTFASHLHKLAFRLNGLNYNGKST